MSISVRGPFPILWAAWTLAMYTGFVWLVWVALAGGDVTTAALFLMCVAATFLPLEITGAVFNSRDPGPEVARTLSQCMQWVAHKTPGHLWWRGWNGFVTANTVAVSTIVGLIFIIGFRALLVWTGLPAVVGVVLGVVMGLLTFFWNFWHWQQRSKYG